MNTHDLNAVTRGDMPNDDILVKTFQEAIKMDDQDRKTLAAWEQPGSRQLRHPYRDLEASGENHDRSLRHKGRAHRCCDTDGIPYP
jgi:hypothetical protein